MVLRAHFAHVFCYTGRVTSRPHKPLQFSQRFPKPLTVPPLPLAGFHTRNLARTPQPRFPGHARSEPGGHETQQLAYHTASSFL